MLSNAKAAPANIHVAARHHSRLVVALLVLLLPLVRYRHRRHHHCTTIRSRINASPHCLGMMAMVVLVRFKPTSIHPLGIMARIMTTILGTMVVAIQCQTICNSKCNIIRHRHHHRRI